MAKLEVDHVVADALWQRLVNRAIEVKQSAMLLTTDEEKAAVAPDDFESRYDALSFINLLGNCSLLEKTFNISKSDEPMWNFLEDVHEFKEGQLQRHEWEEALALSETLTSPDNSNLADIKNAVQTRDALIRRDLTDFIAGRKHRVD